MVCQEEKSNRAFKMGPLYTVIDAFPFSLTQVKMGLINQEESYGMTGQGIRGVPYLLLVL